MPITVVQLSPPVIQISQSGTRVGILNIQGTFDAAYDNVNGETMDLSALCRQVIGLMGAPVTVLDAVGALRYTVMWDVTAAFVAALIMRVYFAPALGSHAVHAHDLLVTGGAGAAGTNTVQASAAAGPLTKQEAGSATVPGAGASGVQNNAAVQAHVAAAFAEPGAIDLSTLRFRTQVLAYL